MKIYFMIITSELLTSLIDETFIQVGDKLFIESKDVERRNISPFVNVGREGINSIEFNIGSFVFKIQGQILVFSDCIHFKTFRDDKEIHNLSFILKPKSQNNGEHVIYIDDTGGSYVVSHGLTIYVERIFNEVKRLEKLILGRFKPFEVTINN